jgi:hypothetical protein
MDQTQGEPTSIQTRIVPTREGFNVQVAYNGYPWSTLQACANIGKAMRIQAEIKRGTYNQATLMNALVVPKPAQLEPISSRPYDKSKPLATFILDYIRVNNHKGVTTKDIYDQLESTSISSIAYAVRRLLYDKQLERKASQGTWYYFMPGTLPHTRSPREDVLHILKCNPSGLSSTAIFEEMGVHIPYEYRYLLGHMVKDGLIKVHAAKDRNIYKLYELR